MAIKDLLDLARSKVGSEDSENVKVVLDQLEKEFDDLKQSKALVDTESINRRKKISGLESNIQGLEIERDEWKSKHEAFDDAPLHKELNALKEKYTGVLDNQVKSFEAFYTSIKDHPNFEKAKSRFKIPDAVDGKIDFTTMSPEDTEHNIKAESDLMQLEYFGEIKSASPATGKTIIVGGVAIPTIEEAQGLKEQFGATHPKYIEAVKLRRDNRTI